MAPAKLGRAGSGMLGSSHKRRSTILRTSWVYGPVGRNFLLTMLRLHQQKGTKGDSLRVVADQVGCPTNTAGLASACWQQSSAARLEYSTERCRVASWYDFAVAIGTVGVTTGLPDQAAAVEPIRTTDYPTQARRPSYSLLDSTATHQRLDLVPTHWRQALERTLLQNHSKLQKIIQAAEA